LGSEAIERVRQYKYLETWLNNQLDLTQEYKARIEHARGAFVRLQKLLINRRLNLDLRIRMVKLPSAIVFLTLVYDMEGRILTKAKSWKLSRCGYTSGCSGWNVCATLK